MLIIMYNKYSLLDCFKHEDSFVLNLVFRCFLYPTVLNSFASIFFLPLGEKLFIKTKEGIIGLINNAQESSHIVWLNF